MWVPHQFPVLPQLPPMVLLLRPWVGLRACACWRPGYALGAWLADAARRAWLPSRGGAAVESGLQASARWRPGFARLGMACPRCRPLSELRSRHLWRAAPAFRAAVHCGGCARFCSWRPAICVHLTVRVWRLASRLVAHSCCPAPLASRPLRWLRFVHSRTCGVDTTQSSP